MWRKRVEVDKEMVRPESCNATTDLIALERPLLLGRIDDPFVDEQSLKGEQAGS